MGSRLMILIGLILLIALPMSGEVAGEKGRSTRFIGKLEIQAQPEEFCLFSTEIEEISFKLNSYKDKYKVVRIRGENYSEDPLRLSVEQDSIELELSGGELVSGTFDLAVQDAQIWDVLDEDMRESLAYPLSIRGALGDDSSRRRPQIIYFYSFFPADRVLEVPRLFRYRIKSVDRTILLAPPPETAARN